MQICPYHFKGNCLLVCLFFCLFVIATPHFCKKYRTSQSAGPCSLPPSLYLCVCQCTGRNAYISTLEGAQILIRQNLSRCRPRRLSRQKPRGWGRNVRKPTAPQTPLPRRLTVPFQTPRISPIPPPCSNSILRQLPSVYPVPDVRSPTQNMSMT